MPDIWYYEITQQDVTESFQGLAIGTIATLSSFGLLIYAAYLTAQIMGV